MGQTGRDPYWINVRKFCETAGDEFLKKMKINCLKVDSKTYKSDYCKCLPRLCNTKGELLNITMISPDHLMLFRYLPWRDIEKYIRGYREVLIDCSEFKLDNEEDPRNCREDYTIEIPVNFNSLAKSCFTMNSLIFRPNETTKMVVPFGEIVLDLKHFEEDYPLTIKESKIYISFHNRYTIINPMKDGFMLKTSMIYHYRFRKIVKKLLPHPYDTNCVDYLTQWKERGGSGPTNIEHCIQECQRNLSVERHGCIFSRIYYPGFDPLCESFAKFDGFNEEAQVCVDKYCKPACYDESYVVTVESEIGKQEYCNKAGHRERNSKSVVRMMLNGMETTVYTYRPKYYDIEIFSYIGGYIGLWLGISLIAMFDFLETVFYLLKYPLRRVGCLKDEKNLRRFQTGPNTMH